MAARGTLFFGLLIALAVGANAGSRPPRGADWPCAVPGCLSCSPNDAKACQVCDTMRGFALQADNTCARANVADPRAKLCRGAPPAAANAQSWPKKCKFEKIGTVCQTFCLTGFTTATPLAATCSAGGVWTVSGACLQPTPTPSPSPSPMPSPSPSPSPIPDPSPSPAPNTCSGSPQVDNADFTNDANGEACTDLSADSTCTGTCAEGFKGFPTDQITATCTDGEWVTDDVVCDAITCPDLPEADPTVEDWANFDGVDGSVCQQAVDGDQCTGACASNPDGTAVAVCTDQGWTTDISC